MLKAEIRAERTEGGGKGGGFHKFKEFADAQRGNRD
jgi:hypothetical protein